VSTAEPNAYQSLFRLDGRRALVIGVGASAMRPPVRWPRTVRR